MLTGAQIEKLVLALSNAYSVSELKRMLKYRLEMDLEGISISRNKRDLIFDLIEKAERMGWTKKLIIQAHEYNPGNRALARLAQSISQGDMKNVEDDERLERLIKLSSKFQSISELILRLSEIEARICKISVNVASGKTLSGTGFLVGPDLVLTNFHVIEDIVLGRASVEGVECVFDYKALADKFGTVLTGRKEKLRESDWLIDYSPHSDSDTQVNGGSIAPNELDYALLRLRNHVGSEPIDTNIGSLAKRGWIAIDRDFPLPVAGDVIAIAQHPMSEPQKIAYGSVLNLHEHGLRIRYDASTERGSSGAPCFTSDLELFALHHAGDPNFEKMHRAEFNQGIPMEKIVSLMRSRGISL